MAALGEDGRTPALVADTLAENLLKGIYGFLERGIRDQGARGDRRTDEIIDTIVDSTTRRSKASEANSRAVDKALKDISGNQSRNESSSKKDRATQKALFGKINKDVNSIGKNIIGGLSKIASGIKQAFSSLTNFIGPYLRNSVKSFDNLAKIMRAANLSPSEKAQIQRAASGAIGDVESKFGLKMGSNEINDALGSLITAEKNINEMSQDQIASFLALTKRGYDTEAAYSMAMTSLLSQTQEVVKNSSSILSSSATRAFNSLSEVDRSVAGDANTAIELQQILRSIKEQAGAALNPAAAEQIALAQFKMNHSLYESMTDQERSLVAAFGMESGKQLDSVAKVIKNTNTTDIRILQESLGKDVAAGIATGQQMLRRGQGIGQNIRSEAADRAADSRNTKDGLLQQKMDKLVHGLDTKLFGGALGDLSNAVDELFGDSGDTAQIISTGFKFVLKSLSMIVLNTSDSILAKIIKAGAAFAGIAAITELLANESEFSKMFSPIIDNLAKIGKTLLANLPKILWNVLQKLPSIFGSITDTVSGWFSSENTGESKASSAMSGIKDAFSSLSGKLSGATSNNTTKETRQSAMGAMRDNNSSLDGKAIASGIGSFIGKIADFLKEILGPIATAIGDVAVELVKAISHVADILSPIAIALGSFIEKLGNSIPQIINVLQSIVDGVVKVAIEFKPIFEGIVDIIGYLVKGIVPLLPKIVDGILGIVKGIVPYVPKIINSIVIIVKELKPVFMKLVDSIVPVVSTIADVFERVVAPILPTLFDTVEKIVSDLVPLASQIMSIIDTAINQTLPNLTEQILVPINKLVDVFCEMWEFSKPLLYTLRDDILYPLYWSLKFFFNEKLPALWDGIPKLWEQTKVVLKAEWDFVKAKAKSMIVGSFDSILAWGWGLYAKIQDLTGDIIAAMPWNEEEDAAKYRGIADEARKKSEGYTKEAKDLSDAADAAFKRLGEEGAALKEIYDNWGNTEHTWDEYMANEKATLEKRIELDELKAQGDKDLQRDVLQPLAECVKVIRDSIPEITNNFLNPIKTVVTTLSKPILSATELISTLIMRIYTEWSQHLFALDANTNSIYNSMSNKATRSLTTFDQDDSISQMWAARSEYLNSIPKFANGGPVDKATLAVVGEDGKEIILPLNKPNEMAKIISSLSPADKKKVGDAAAKANARNITKDNSGASAADLVIQFARDQLNKPYSTRDDGFVCNTLVHAAYKAAGLLKGWGLGYHNVTKWFTNEPRLHKVPLSEAKPGMIGFSNPGKNGIPQHMGIITENGMWINASGSNIGPNWGAGFKASPNSKGVVEVAMNRTSKSGMMDTAGYIDGLFDPATVKYLKSKEVNLGVADGISAEGAGAKQPVYTYSEFDKWLDNQLNPYQQLYNRISTENGTGDTGTFTAADQLVHTGSNIIKFGKAWLEQKALFNRAMSIAREKYPSDTQLLRLYQDFVTSQLESKVSDTDNDTSLAAALHEIINILKVMSRSQTRPVATRPVSRPFGT